LSLELDDLVDRAIFKSLFAIGLCSIAGTILAAAGIPNSSSTLILLMGLVFGSGGAYATVLVVRDLSKGQKWRLGLRGEQAVAEALQEVADGAYRAFHDFVFPGEQWNIDHIAVGPAGVFLIETKARNRARPRRNQPQAAHVVQVAGDRLNFPTFHDEKAISQAERNAKKLADFLTKMTGEKVEVQALVVLPGWYVEIQQPPANGTRVMNAKYLVQYLRGRPARLADAQVRRIAALLDEKCRDVEF
jgi:Nuclease-related domain